MVKCKQKRILFNYSSIIRVLESTHFIRNYLNFYFSSSMTAAQCKTGFWLEKFLTADWVSGCFYFCFAYIKAWSQQPAEVCRWAGGQWPDYSVIQRIEKSASCLLAMSFSVFTLRCDFLWQLSLHFQFSLFSCFSTFSFSLFFSSLALFFSFSQHLCCLSTQTTVWTLWPWMLLWMR